MQDERGPGLDFNLCLEVVREGLPLYFCVYLFVLKYFKCSPVPASFFPIYELCYKYIINLL